MTRLAMFPLGTVLLPYGVLPLHVFEPRYRAMLRDVTAEDAPDPPEFGVVLIERGSEVGGGDVRTSLGTRARIVRAEELPDGRWYVVAVGVARLRVRTWLPDDPYPVADVEDVPDAGHGIADLGGVLARLRRVLALRAELGDAAAPLSLELDDDPASGSWQAAVAAGLSPVDAQRLLAAPGVEERIALLERLLVEEAEILELRLGS